MVHYFGGQEIGASHFDSYKETATSAISQSSYNSIVRANQFPLSAVDNKPKNVATVAATANVGNAGYSCAVSPRPYPTSQSSNADKCNSWATANPVSNWVEAVVSDPDTEVTFRGRADSFPGLPSKPIGAHATTCSQPVRSHNNAPPMVNS